MKLLKDIKEKLSKRWKTGLIIVAFAIFISTVFAASALAADTTYPTVLSVSPMNNEKDIATHDVVTVQFSESMDTKTINADTFILMQRTTPAAGSQSSAYRSTQIEGTVTYNGLIATFTPKNPYPQSGYNPMQPSQEYGNVFTVMITTGVKDLAGNPLSRDYVWSFTTGLNQFNTGATTSQLDQTAVPIGGSVVSPTQTSAAPITGQAIGAQETSAIKSPWVWIIGGLLLLLLIASIFAFRKPAPQKNIKDKPPNSHFTLFGDVHPVMDLEGIGPVHNKSLQSMGIKNTQQLWEADAVKVAHETSAPLSSVKSWQNMAELASVKDIGPQYAELLERSGIHSIDQLKNYNSDKLLKLVRKKQNSLKVNIQGNSPGHALVENWIGQARNHKLSYSEGQAV